MFLAEWYFSLNDSIVGSAYLNIFIFFQSLYESIKTEPFKIPEDDGNDLMHTFFNPDKEGWLWKQGNGFFIFVYEYIYMSSFFSVSESWFLFTNGTHFIYCFVSLWAIRFRYMSLSWRCLFSVFIREKCLKITRKIDKIIILCIIV